MRRFRSSCVRPSSALSRSALDPSAAAKMPWENSPCSCCMSRLMVPVKKLWFWNRLLFVCVASIDDGRGLAVLPLPENGASDLGLPPADGEISGDVGSRRPGSCDSSMLAMESLHTWFSPMLVLMGDTPGVREANADADSGCGGGVVVPDSAFFTSAAGAATSSRPSFDDRRRRGGFSCGDPAGVDVAEVFSRELFTARRPLRGGSEGSACGERVGASDPRPVDGWLGADGGFAMSSVSDDDTATQNASVSFARCGCAAPMVLVTSARRFSLDSLQ
mmetsp:Transcript_42935/g.132659  ORF Transcript_42935/g.132659 Transcript_42935/m.132659 type:complete len:276 (-) Transcript_42935:378-1205(-)